MAYFVIAIISMVCGGILAYFALEPKRRLLEEGKRELDDRADQLHQSAEALDVKQLAVKSESSRLANITTRLEAESRRLESAKLEFDSKVVSFEELQQENLILKRDLRNLDVHDRKMQLDRDQLRQTQDVLDERVSELGARYLKENVKWIGTSLNPNNFATCKQRLLDVIGRCRGIGFDVSQDNENGLISDLKSEYEKVVRAAFEREEQNRIKAQIREDQLRQREIVQLDRELAAIQAAIERSRDKDEIERLKARLAAVDKQRAISQAQLTRSGYVYVISNIGSFGKDTFKVGMTRRIEFEERIRELSSASVPFPFDVHMKIKSDDAPTLENALHRQLHKLRVNKANPRKEFFRVDIETIRRIVTELHGEVEYLADAEALQYRQSLTMSDADEEFIESVYNELEDETASELDEF